MDYIINISPEKVALKTLRNSDKHFFEFVDNNKATKLDWGDNFITINRANTYDGEYFFNHTGSIRGDDKVETLSEADASQLIEDYDPKIIYYKHQIPIRIESELKKDNLLDEYTYSLIGIRNFANPQRHFSRKITLLSPDDYKTITERLIYVSRTVFARLVNALPRENRQDFILQSMVHFDTVDLKTVQFTKAISFLKDYIEDNFLSRGRLLISIKDMLEEHFDGMSIPIQQLSFSRDESDVRYSGADTIIRQANSFNSLFSVDSQLNMIDKVFEAIRQNNDIETRFHKLFSKSSWPVDLRI